MWVRVDSVYTGIPCSTRLPVIEHRRRLIGPDEYVVEWRGERKILTRYNSSPCAAVTRSYVVGVPLVVHIDENDVVTYAVDLSEANDAPYEDNDLYPDDEKLRDADAALIEADATAREGWATIESLKIH